MKIIDNRKHEELEVDVNTVIECWDATMKHNFGMITQKEKDDHKKYNLVYLNSSEKNKKSDNIALYNWQDSPEEVIDRLQVMFNFVRIVKDPVYLCIGKPGVNE